jgi:hypothetical protein
MPSKQLLLRQGQVAKLATTIYAKTECNPSGLAAHEVTLHAVQVAASSFSIN